MCGIIGYIGDKDLLAVLLVGLEKLSYRGYDSSGISVITNNEISTWKKSGKTQVLSDHLSSLTVQGGVGIGHTRWATHGTPSDKNSHPHNNRMNSISIVHNGIIENFLPLKNELQAKGYIFLSETDTEVLVHLISDYYTNNLMDAFSKALSRLEGSFAVAMISEYEPESIYVARKSSPLIIGVSKDEMFIASEINVLLSHTKDVVYLEDNEIAVITKQSFSCYDAITLQEISKTIDHVNSNIQNSAEKNGFSHFMLKEIYEQPKIIENILDKYLNNKEITFPTLIPLHNELKNVNRFVIQACGTSWHAGLIAKFFIEKHARIAVDIDTSSELRYRDLISTKNDVVLAISQSGETADTLACLRESKSRFQKVISFVNVKNSAMHLESDAVIFSHSGQEIGVASTKNFLAQVVTLLLFSLYIGKLNGHLSDSDLTILLEEIKLLPGLVNAQILNHNKIKSLSKKLSKHKNFLFIGRGVNYPSALEASLKLKEISYIHSTAYPAGELKHGPIALIDENLPVIAICPETETYDKMFSNIQEVKSRSAITVVIATEGDEQIKEYADFLITIPKIIPFLTPILIAVPLQLFSYEIASILGCDVDKPRNLAKSVTVE